MTAAETAPTRRVRPWIAALLTLLLGWGVGLFYARRTGAAVRWAGLSIVFGIALAAAFMAGIYFGVFDPARLIFGDMITIADVIGLIVSIFIAIWVWRLAAKQQTVARGGGGRLFGYLAIWLVPVLISLMLGFALRGAALHPFRQPSGSMQPALTPGAYFLVEKWSYGYSRYSAAPFEGLLPAGRIFARAPQRGDIVVFRPPPEPHRDFVKRLIGLPGDRIQMIDGVLHINGAAVGHEAAGEISILDYGGETIRVPAFRETLPNGVSYLVIDRMNGELDNTREYRVPEGHYFMLGDDRDNSADSRVPSVIGYVPFDNLIGRVATRTP